MLVLNIGSPINVIGRKLDKRKLNREAGRMFDDVDRTVSSTMDKFSDESQAITDVQTTLTSEGGEHQAIAAAKRHNTELLQAAYKKIGEISDASNVYITAKDTEVSQVRDGVEKAIAAMSRISHAEKDLKRSEIDSKASPYESKADEIRKKMKEQHEKDKEKNKINTSNDYNDYKNINCPGD